MRTVAIGRVTKPRGLRGEVFVRGEPDELALLEFEVPLFLRAAGHPRPVEIDRLSPVKGGYAIRFAGVADRNAAEALRDAIVEIDADALPAPTLESHGWRQIEGWEAVTDEGRRLGVVVSRIVTGSHDVLVIEDEEHRETLVPDAPGIVTALDAEARRLTVTPVPGLLELNES